MYSILGMNEFRNLAGWYMTIQLVSAVPSLPVKDITHSIGFYRDLLGFTLVHQEPGFAVLQRNAVEVHVWQASDESWRTRRRAEPIVSGAESFLAGTASCRIAVEGVDGLYQELQPQGVVHPHAPLATQPWRTREFGVLDPDKNLITFFERL